MKRQLQTVFAFQRTRSANAGAPVNVCVNVPVKPVGGAKMLEGDPNQLTLGEAW